MDIDDTIICERCGKEETRRGQNQKYCKSCAYEILLVKRRERYRERRLRMMYEQEIAGDNERPKKTLICDICGIEVERHSWNQRYCSDCAEIAKKESIAKYKRATRETSEPKPAPQRPRVKRKPKLSISQIVALARAEGLTYGQYVANENEIDRRNEK